MKLITNRKIHEMAQVCRFEPIGLNNENLPPFLAGSHIDVVAPNGTARQYSLCNNPSQTHRYVIAVLRERLSRGGSSAMHDMVQIGSILEIGGPRNCLPLVSDALHSVLIAGGIGITPIHLDGGRLGMEKRKLRAQLRRANSFIRGIL